jgi:hypothetical protein
LLLVSSASASAVAEFVYPRIAQIAVSKPTIFNLPRLLPETLVMVVNLQWNNKGFASWVRAHAFPAARELKRFPTSISKRL